MPGKAATSLGELSDESLWCRTESHRFAWVRDEATVNARKEVIEVTRWFECEECGAPAKRLIRRIRGRWHAFPRKITAYPDGYLLKGLGRLHKSEFYDEFFERQFA